MEKTENHPTAIAFWHENLGKHLSDLGPSESPKTRIETRMKKGIGLNTLGAGIAAHYIVTQAHSWLIGKIERSNIERVTFVPSDANTGITSDQYIANWLVSDAFTTPCMVGVIGNASPNSSFKISHTPQRVYYCEAGGGFDVDVTVVKDAIKLIGDLSWWKTVRPAVLQFASYQESQQNPDIQRAEKEREKLKTLLAKVPALNGILADLRVKPNSGEMKLLGLIRRD